MGGVLGTWVNVDTKELEQVTHIINSQNLGLAGGQVTRGFSGPRMRLNALCLPGVFRKTIQALAGRAFPALISPAVMVVLVGLDLRGLSMCPFILQACLGVGGRGAEAGHLEGLLAVQWQCQ